jgi:two-component system response regulator VanR
MVSLDAVADPPTPPADQPGGRILVDQMLGLLAPRQRAVMHLKDLSIDHKARRVWIDHREARLTRLEFDVLAYLFDNRGDAISRQELLERVWGCSAPDERSDDTVKSCISRLRRKLGDDAQNPRYIQNVWGVGYALEE